MSAILDWIRSHPWLDTLRGAAGIVLAVAVISVSIGGIVYAGFFLLRLTRKNNVKEFLKRPFPAPRSMEVLGQKVDFRDSERLDAKLWVKIRQVGEAVDKIEKRTAIHAEVLRYLAERRSEKELP